MNKKDLPKNTDERNPSVAPFEENPEGSLETGLIKGKESFSPSKNEENERGHEDNKRGEEENDFRSNPNYKTKKDDNEKEHKQSTVTKIMQGVIISSSVVLIVVGLIMVGQNYLTKGPTDLSGLIALSGDNAVSFRFSLTNSGKMNLKLVAKSNYGKTTLELPSPWKKLEGSEVSCSYNEDSPSVYTLEGVIDGLRYDTSYDVTLVGNNKIVDKTYSSAQVRTASFDETKDVGFYWECHCLKDGYCSYQVIYPITYTNFSSFRIDLTGKKNQKGFSLTITDKLHDVHTFYALSKDPGAYNASIYGLDASSKETLVKTADVAI